MPAYFEEGFMVRQPAWHGLGVVLDDYPGREEAMRLAGHDFTVVEEPVYNSDGPIEGWKSLVKVPFARTDAEIHEWLEGDTITIPSTRTVLNVARESYGVVQNDVGWDIVDAIIGEGAKYETGLTLKEGAVCSVLAWLDEPTKVPGDDSSILPYLNVSWAHDGSGSFTGRATSIRTVCWNTQSAAEAQGKRSETDFTFRHTAKVMDRIEEAKDAVKGMRSSHAEYMELARELATIPVTAEQRELFVTTFIPMPPEALISERVKGNVEEARLTLRMTFDSPSVPEAHRFTAYGMHLVGGEYLDHLRGARNAETRYGRSLLRREPAKAKLTRLVREVAKA